jgi:hypothetical protein
MMLVLSVDPGYPQGAPLQINCVGVPLSCRFFMRGEPPHKNAACGYPQISACTSEESAVTTQLPTID